MEKVADLLFENIYRFKNQSFYSEPVGTYVINLKEKVLLFDIPTYSQSVKKFLQSFDKPCAALLSHGSCGISDGAKWQNEINLKVYLQKNDANHPWLNMNPDIMFDIDPELHGEVEIIWTPGHSAGSVVLLHKTSKSLFTGDTVEGDNGEIHNFIGAADYDNELRLKSVQNLMKYEFVNVLPFHYDMILGDAKEKLKGFLQKH